MNMRVLVIIGIIALAGFLYMQGIDLKVGKDFEIGIGKNYG